MGPGEFLNINFFTALFTLVNTVALFFVLKKYLFAPVMKMIRDRQQEIESLYLEADQTKLEAADLRAAYEEKLSVAAQTGERMVKEAVARGQRREEDILRQANAQADAIRRKAHADIVREKKKALHDAKREIADLAMDIADKVVGYSLSSVVHGKLVDRFIEELGDGL